VKLTRTAETSFANASTGHSRGRAVRLAHLAARRRLIIDDPHSTETAESDTERLNTTRKFREGAVNRLNDQERSAIVVIMQRLHEQDISGVIISLGMDYVHLMLPMEFDPSRACETIIGFRDPREEDGQLLDPARFPRSTVEACSATWAATPIPASTSNRRRRARAACSSAATSRSSTRCRQAARTGEGVGLRRIAAEAGQAAGLDRRLKMLLVKDTFYIEDVLRGRWSPSEVETNLKNTATQDGQMVTVRMPQDPGAAGKADAETKIKLLKGYAAVVKPITGDKATRARPASAQCEAGNVKLLRGPLERHVPQRDLRVSERHIRRSGGCVRGCA
jgi:predicted phage terminase large subunit-like protein